MVIVDWVCEDDGFVYVEWFDCEVVWCCDDVCEWM